MSVWPASIWPSLLPHAGVAAPPVPLVVWLTHKFLYLNRSRRILLALAAMWIVHAFDLGFTLLEAHSEHFRELNPVAATILKNEALVTAYKFSLLTFATLVILPLRRRMLAELAAWLMLALSVYVAVRWHCYYLSLATGHINPFITAD